MLKSELLRDIWHRVRVNWRLPFCIFVPIILSPIAWGLKGVLEFSETDDDPNKKFRAAYVIALMATFWVLEVIPVAVTSLFPLVLFPLMGVQDGAAVSKNYMKESNMIFLGAIILALAIEYCGLHLRLALRVISTCGTNPAKIMLGVMIITAVLSMWLSETTTTTMMIPILTAVTAAMFREEQEELMEEPAPGPDPTSSYRRVRRESCVFANSAMERPVLPTSTVRRMSRNISLDPNELSIIRKRFANSVGGFSDSGHSSHSGHSGGSRQGSSSLPVSSMAIIMEDMIPREEDEDEAEEEEEENTNKPEEKPKVDRFQPKQNGSTNNRRAIPKEKEEPEEEEPERNSFGGLDEQERQQRIRKMLLFASAYSASVGGTASLVGTGPLKVFKELAKEYNLEKNKQYVGITFTTWMAFNIPPLIINILIMWIFLMIRYIGLRGLRKGCNTTDAERKKVREYLNESYEKLGPMSAHEIGVLVVFIVVLVLWLTRDPQFTYGWNDLNTAAVSGDSTPAMFGAVLLFVIPRTWSFCQRGDYSGSKYEALLDWKFVSSNAPWGYVLLIGSGYAIADAAEVSGLSHFLAETLGDLVKFPNAVLLLIVMAITAVLTEIVSNTACASLILPVIFTVSCRVKVHPLFLTMASAISASYAFMFPISSPPNAIIFATGELNTSEMMINGIIMSVMCCTVLFVAILTYGEVLFHFSSYDGVCPF